MKDYGIEWDRVLLTTLGVANKRLYELRLQTAVVGGVGLMRLGMRWAYGMDIEFEVSWPHHRLGCTIWFCTCAGHCSPGLSVRLALCDCGLVNLRGCEATRTGLC
jgi:hypothetical protein